MRALVIVTCLAMMAWPRPGSAQDSATLADIRQQMSVLFVELQRLRRELSTTEAPSTGAIVGGPLERIDRIEAELQRLTARTEELEFRIDRIVSDGTNRLGDLEFRLVELEGGDVSQLGETTTLGGQAPSSGATASGQAPSDGASAGVQMAVGEEADFRAASEALASGDHVRAAALFERFVATYPGGPMNAEAHLRRGQALAATGDITSAARAYLESFSGAPQSPVAPEALFRLGAALGQLDQKVEACVTLSEVAVRFPGDPMVGNAEAEMRALACS